MKRIDYLARILKARVYDVAAETPLEPARALSKRMRNTLLIKREDLQSVFSFKLRGAYNKMAGLPKARLRRGVIAASASAISSTLSSRARVRSLARVPMLDFASEAH